MSRPRRVCPRSVIVIVRGVVARLEQADRRRAADRSRSQRRRITGTPDETETACHCLYLQMYGVGIFLCIIYDVRE